VKGNAGKCAYHVTVNGELTRKVQRFGFGLMDAMRGKTKVQVKATESGVMCILPQALFSNLHWGGKFAGHVLRWQLVCLAGKVGQTNTGQHVKTKLQINFNCFEQLKIKFKK